MRYFFISKDDFVKLSQKLEKVNVAKIINHVDTTNTPAVFDADVEYL